MTTAERTKKKEDNSVSKDKQHKINEFLDSQRAKANKYRNDSGTVR